MELNKDILNAAGLQVIAVGLGEPKHAERYCSKMTLNIACLSDTTNDSHFAYGIGRMGVLQGLNPNLIRAGMRAAKEGHSQGKATGDVLMLNGSFIIDRSGVVRWAHYNTHPGDHPAIEEILTVAKGLAQPQRT